MVDTTALHSDPTAGIDFHRPDDRFLPVQVGDLVTALGASDRVPLGRPELLEFANHLQRVIEQETSALDWHLAERYAPLNPDRDTIVSRESGRPPIAAVQAGLRYMLDKANFEQLTGVQLEGALRVAREHGLRVRLRPEKIDSLDIWVRGRGQVSGEVSKPLFAWRRRPSGTVVYRRLAIVAALKNDPNLHIKLFKEIPLHEIDILLPHAETTMTWFDQLSIVSGGSVTIGTTATKVFGLMGAVTALSQFAWVIMFGGGVLAYRTFMGYRRARNWRDSIRTRHLYFQNLSNNAGALHYLVGMLAQEEMKEALLAYAFCAARNPPRDELELRYRVESFLLATFGIGCRFDVADAVHSLTRLGLRRDATSLAVISAAEATANLLDLWRERRTSPYHVERLSVQPPAAR